MVTSTLHVSHRLAGRFAGVVTAREIEQAVRGVKTYQVGQTRVHVKTLDREVCLEGGKFRGQEVYAVVDKQDSHDAGRIVTLLIFRKGSKVETYFPYDGSMKDHRVNSANKQFRI